MLLHQKAKQRCEVGSIGQQQASTTCLLLIAMKDVMQARRLGAQRAQQAQQATAVIHTPLTVQRAMGDAGAKVSRLGLTIGVQSATQDSVHRQAASSQVGKQASGRAG